MPAFLIYILLFLFRRYIFLLLNLKNRGTTRIYVAAETQTTLCYFTSIKRQPPIASAGDFDCFVELADELLEEKKTFSSPASVFFCVVVLRS